MISLLSPRLAGVFETFDPGLENVDHFARLLLSFRLWWQDRLGNLGDRTPP
jgi:hypothetical protein